MDDDEYGGYAAGDLTVTVGYFGGPYYEKKTFTLEELWSMNLVRDDYTFIDNMPSVIIDHVAGVPLADITEAAGIDLASVQNYNFWTLDKTGSYYTSMTKSYLIDTPRYCYYSLPDNFDYDLGEGNAYAAADARWAPTLIALADDWNRVIAGASFGSDYQNLNTNTRFRLIFGQTDTRERTASRSAKWIHKIEITLGGAPSLTLDRTALEGKVGSRLHIEARLRAADPAVTAGAQIQWESSDPDIASVDQNGEIVILAGGRAVITAHYGDVSAALVVNGQPGPDQYEGQSPGEAVSVSESTPDPPAGESTPEAGAPAPAKTAQDVLTAQEISLLPQPGAQNGEERGGVQNWRQKEMAADAAELPNIEEDSPLRAPAAAGALALFSLGVAARTAAFRRDLRPL
jgi:hypothetical protein